MNPDSNLLIIGDLDPAESFLIILHTWVRVLKSKYLFLYFLHRYCVFNKSYLNSNYMTASYFWLPEFGSLPFILGRFGSTSWPETEAGQFYFKLRIKESSIFLSLKASYFTFFCILPRSDLMNKKKYLNWIRIVELLLSSAALGK